MHFWKVFIIVFCSLVFKLGLPVGQGIAFTNAGTVKPLKFWEIKLPADSKSKFDASAIEKFQDKWLVVSDSPAHKNVYFFELGNSKSVATKTFLAFKTQKKISRPDFEGLTLCNGHLLVVDENAKSIIKSDLKGRAEVYKIDLKKMHKKKGIPAPGLFARAGLEGISCDEEKGLIYVAKERKKRMIYVLKWPTFEFVDLFEVDTGWKGPKMIDKYKVYPDFADIHFTGGYLYAVERQTHKVLKIDLKTRRLVSYLKLDFDERDYYRLPKAVGLSDGLYLTDTKIYIVLDNNGLKRRSDEGNKLPILFEFERPKGF